MIDRIRCFLNGHRWTLLSTSLERRSGIRAESWACSRCPAVDVVRRRSPVPLSPAPGGLLAMRNADRLIYAGLLAIAAVMVIVGVARGYYR